MLGIILLAIAAFANIVLGIFVLANNPRARLNQMFAGLAFALAGWNIVTYFEDAGLPYDAVKTFVNLDFMIASVMIAFFMAFCYEIVKSKNKIIILLAWAQTAALLLLTPLGLIVSVRLTNAGVKFEEQSLYFIFIIYLIYTILGGLLLLLARNRKAVGREKTQIELIFFGLFLTSATIIVTNVVLPNVISTPPDVTRIGIYSTLFLTGFIAYAIVKHRFMNVRLIVARSVAYILLLATLAAIYATLVFGISALIFPNDTTSILQKVFYVTLAVILAFTFQPLKTFFEHLTERIFFRDHYDSQVVLSDIGQILVAEFKLERLLRKSLVRVCQDLKIATAQFYVFDEGDIYKVEHYGAVPHKLITANHLQTLRHRTLVADELPDGHEKQLMDEFGYRVVMHLRTREEFVGFLLLGDKLSGDIYTAQDIEVLEILSQELAVAISNAKAYEDIAEFNATLQDKVDDATKRLRTANIHLKELDAAKDEFISMASHQLRTPLTTIKGYLSMLQEGDAGKMSKEQLEFINYAYTGSQRMVNLISDLLNVSRMSAGKFLIEKSAVDLNQMAAEEVQQLQSHAVAKNLKLTYEPPKDKLPPIELDDNKTRQVLMNFIDNAVYYTKEGSVTVSLAKAGDSVELRVKDTGIGVPPDAQKKLFTKFFRAGNAQTVRPDGTGLGLYLAKRVIEDQGGTIIFETAEGKGSTFGFSMPLKAKKVTADGKSK